MLGALSRLESVRGQPLREGMRPLLRAMAVIMHFTGLRWANAMSLSQAHIDISPLRVIITPPCSKTDQHATAWGDCPMHLPARPGDALCPVAALVDAAVPGARSVFAMPDGTAPLRNALSAALEAWLHHTDAGIDTSAFTWHSFRIGAATDLAVAGAPLHVIKRLLCWRSDSSAEIYMRKEPDTYAQWMHVLAGARPPAARPGDGPPALAFPVAIAAIRRATIVDP